MFDRVLNTPLKGSEYALILNIVRSYPTTRNALEWMLVVAVYIVPSYFHLILK